MSEKESRTRKIALYLGIVLTVVLILNQGLSFYLNANKVFKESETTDSGETLTIEVKCDSGSPLSLFHAAVMNIKRDGWRAWSLSWKVGTTEVTSVETSLSITVTGINVQSTASVDYYIKAVSSSDSQKWTKELDKTGQSVTVGGAALEDSSGSVSIDTHIGNMGLAIDQDQIVDYYIYVKVTTTGTISGENLVAEIAEIKFDAVEYLYVQQICQVTLDNPTEDGHIQYCFAAPSYSRAAAGVMIGLGKQPPPPSPYHMRGYVEWDVSGIPSGSTILDTVFKYDGRENYLCDGHIHEMVGTRPTTSADADVYAEMGEGTVYADPADFPVANINQQVDLGTSADADLESQLSAGWFAIGLQGDIEGPVGTANYGSLHSEEATSGHPTPAPSLYVEYSTSGASWYIIPPLSIVDLPVTLNVVAVLVTVLTTAFLVHSVRRNHKWRK